MNPSVNHTATPAGIIGMPGWFASEQVAGFDRNRWLVSSEYALMSRRSSQLRGENALDNAASSCWRRSQFRSGVESVIGTAARAGWVNPACFARLNKICRTALGWSAAARHRPASPPCGTPARTGGPTPCHGRRGGAEWGLVGHAATPAGWRPPAIAASLTYRAGLGHLELSSTLHVPFRWKTVSSSPASS
jgi:hypothetical protein